MEIIAIAIFQFKKNKTGKRKMSAKSRGASSRKNSKFISKMQSSPRSIL
jgi:hypothetical protein